MTIKELKLKARQELEGANTLEEIITASWSVLRYSYKDLEEKDEIIKIIDRKKNEFYKKKLEEKRNIVYEELLANFVSGDYEGAVDRVSKVTNLKWWEIKELILTKKNPDKVDKVLARYILKMYQQSGEKERELNRRIIESKIKVLLVEQSGYNSFIEFSKHYNRVPRVEIDYAYDTIKKYDQEFYKTLNFPFSTAKKQRNNLSQARSIYSQTTTNEVKEALKNGISELTLKSNKCKELVAFCEKYELPVVLVKKYIALLGEERQSFFSLDCDKQVANLLEYKRKELEKAQPIIEQLILTKTTVTSKKTIDYYYFYKNGFYKDYFVRLLTSCNLHNATYLFNEYYEEHRKSFECFDERNVYVLAKRENMFMEGKLVNYKTNDFLDVIGNLKEENLPLSKGLVYQKLQEKENTKKANKTIVKNRSM